MPMFSARSWTGGGEGDIGHATTSLSQKGESICQLHSTDRQWQEGEEGQTQRSASLHYNKWLIKQSKVQTICSQFLRINLKKLNTDLTYCTAQFDSAEIKCESSRSCLLQWNVAACVAFAAVRCLTELKCLWWCMTSWHTTSGDILYSTHNWVLKWCFPATATRLWLFPCAMLFNINCTVLQKAHLPKSLTINVILPMTN